MLKVGEFVRKAKQVYNQAQKASIVIGNQSADLDSIASAISMSYYLTSVSQDMTTYIPFINSTHLFSHVNSHTFIHTVHTYLLTYSLISRLLSQDISSYLKRNTYVYVYVREQSDSKAIITQTATIQKFLQKVSSMS